MKTFWPLSTRERKQLFKFTAATPRTLETWLRHLSPPGLLRRPTGGFSPHEQVWHLADLEREGFERRIQRVLSEADPMLENFAGNDVAAARCYHSLPLGQGLRVFADARLRNLWRLSGVNHADWMRRGVLEGLGPLSLADVLRAMAGHDRAHLAEIQALLPEGTIPRRSKVVAA